MITDTFTLNHKQHTKKYEEETEFLRILAMGRKSSIKIQQVLECFPNDYQTLVLSLSGLVMEPENAKRTIQKLNAHKVRLEQAIGRPVGIKIAALDFLENIDYILNQEGIVDTSLHDSLKKSNGHNVISTNCLLQWQTSTTLNNLMIYMAIPSVTMLFKKPPVLCNP